MHQAAFNGYEKMLEMLIQAGGNIQSINNVSMIL